MKYKKRHITLFLILIWRFSFSQEYTNYTIKDGLPSNHIYRITQDYEGFIWIITDKGISKFDGKTFKNFTTKNGLPTNDIWHIKITPNNKIWYFSKSNKLGYIFKDKVYSFSSKTNNILYPRYIIQSKNKIAFNDGTNHFELKDSIWKTERNLFFNNEFAKFKVFHSEIKTFTISDKPDIFVLNQKDKELVFPIINNDVRKESSQINDSLLFSITNKQRYIIANLNTKKVKQLSFSSQKIAKNQYYFRNHNVNNEIQFTGLNFVAYLASDLQLKNIITIPKKLKSHFSFVDKTGNIWSATFNNGVYMLPKEKQNVSVVAKNKKIQQLKIINNTIYTGIFQEGFFKLTDTLYPILKNKNYQHSISAIDNDKTILFSSENNIYTYKNNTVSLVDILGKHKGKLVKITVRKVIEYKDFLYSYNSFGIMSINPKTYIANKTQKLFSVTSFAKNKTNLFTGNQAGLIQIKDNQFVPLKSQPLFSKPVLSQENLNTKSIIVGTDGYGAYITDGINTSFIKKTNDLSVQYIFVDTNKNIWLATQKGVHKAIKKNNDYTITKSFYEADGLISNNINCLVVKNDSLIVGSDIGISILPLNKERTNQLQKIYIKSLAINTKEVKADTIIVPYQKNNHISISFGILNFSNQENLTYQYRLKPIQKKWIPSKTLDINFNELAPKKYTLEFKVTNHHHKELTKNIVIKITPLWYQTLWFKIFGAFFACLSLSVFLIWSKNNIEKKTLRNLKLKQKSIEHELHALRSQMNPHFVFNSLNAIQYYMTNNEMKLSEKYLVKFSRLIRMFFDFSREQFISIEQEIKLLKAYLEIEKMRFGDDFKFYFKLDKTLDLDTKIPTMLLQPIVENSVNHGVFHKKGIGIIEIEFKKSTIKDEFIVLIKDNGIGIEKAKKIKNQSIKKHNSKSTEIIKDRIALINHSLKWNITYKIMDLTDTISTGTAILLTFKQNKNDKSNFS